MADGRVDGYRFRYDHAPDDWSNGCINDGPGYYGRDTSFAMF